MTLCGMAQQAPLPKPLGIRAEMPSIRAVTFKLVMPCHLCRAYLGPATCMLLGLAYCKYVSPLEHKHAYLMSGQHLLLAVDQSCFLCCCASPDPSQYHYNVIDAFMQHVVLSLSLPSPPPPPPPRGPLRPHVIMMSNAMHHCRPASLSVSILACVTKLPSCCIFINCYRAGSTY